LTCSLPYKVQSGVCVTSKFAIAQWGFGSLINSGAFFYAVSISGNSFSLQWAAYNNANAAAWSYIWEFSPIIGSINTYSIRVFATFIVAPNLVATLNPISLASTASSTALSAQLYQEINSMAILDQQWIVTVDATTIGAVNVKSALTNLYLDNGLTLKPTPTPLLLIPQ